MAALSINKESGEKPERSRRRNEESKHKTTGKLGRCGDEESESEYLPLS